MRFLALTPKISRTIIAKVLQTSAHGGAVYRASLLELVSLEIFRQQNMLDLPAVQQSMTIGALSLALNLALTGVFIMMVIRLLARGTET